MNPECSSSYCFSYSCSYVTWHWYSYVVWFSLSFFFMERRWVGKFPFREQPLNKNLFIHWVILSKILFGSHFTIKRSSSVSYLYQFSFWWWWWWWWRQLDKPSVSLIKNFIHVLDEVSLEPFPIYVCKLQTGWCNWNVIPYLYIFQIVHQYHCR